MPKLVLSLLPFAYLFLASSDADADMCEALSKESKGYTDKMATLKRVASVSYSTSEQAKLKKQIDQIRDMCSYRIFIELLKKVRDWEPYVFSSALAAKNTDAQMAFLELITKHAGKWQPATYRCASQLDSKEKANLFKQMLEQAVRVDFPAIAYDVLADINNEAQVEAFSSILQRKTSFNWQDAVFETVKSFKVTKPSPNYPLLAFKAMLYAAEKKDWPAETYSQLEYLHKASIYWNFLKKNALERAAKMTGRLNIKNPFDTFFDHQSLETLVKENNIGSVEKLLPLLPIWLRSNYTLMFYSRSNQEASFQQPRAIMYTPLADFIATFTDSTMKGGDTIETISVNKKTFEFEFREVVFKNGKAQFSAINPLKCAVCHHGDSDLKPNWDEYPFWLGAYGMYDDTITSKVFLRPLHATPQDLKNAEAMLKKIGGMPALENTFEEFKKFRATQQTHPRYQYLDHHNVSVFTYPPYRQEGVPPWLEGNPREIFGVPNELLNELFGAWNIQRIFRRIRNVPAYEKERTNLLYFLAGCESNLANLRLTLEAGIVAKGVRPSSRYDEHFARLGIDYLKMTDLTFDRELMLLNDKGFIGSDARMAYLLAEDLKNSIPDIAKHIKVEESGGDERFAKMNSIAPKLLMVEGKWEGCAALEKAMK